LVAIVVTLKRQRHRLAAVAATVISAWDQRMVWVDNGAGSAAVRLANDTSASPTSTGVEVKRARRLRTMGHVANALAAGDLSADHVDLIAKANQPWRNASFADHEASLVEHCKTLRFRDARKVSDYWCNHADATGAEDRAERQRNAAHLDVSSTLDGTVVVNGVLDPIGGTIVTNEGPPRTRVDIAATHLEPDVDRPMAPPCIDRQAARTARLHACSTETLRHARASRRTATLASGALLLILSSCGSNDDSSKPADPAPNAAGTANELAEAPADYAATGTLTIASDTGMSWSLDQDTCSYNPEGEGEVVELWGASAGVPTAVGSRRRRSPRTRPTPTSSSSAAHCSTRAAMSPGLVRGERPDRRTDRP
jgi:hypothetical protein